MLDLSLQLRSFFLFAPQIHHQFTTISIAKN
jgi:hypothetical protein